MTIDSTSEKVHVTAELAIQYADLSHENRGQLSLEKSCDFLQNFDWEAQELKQKTLIKEKKDQGPAYLFWSREGRFLQLLKEENEGDEESEEGSFVLYTGKLLKWWHVFIPKKQYGESIDQLDELQVEEVLNRFYKGTQDVFGDV
jgi:hypothetical protein